MRSAEGRIGRTFVLRLEDGDMVPHCIEKFAKENGIKSGHVVLIGGVDKGRVVVGPKSTREIPPEKMTVPITEAHEITANGILAPDENGDPVLHIHGSLGRSSETITGCLREGVYVWLVCEAVIYEILGTGMHRVIDSSSGFLLLDIPEKSKH